VVVRDPSADIATTKNRVVYPVLKVACQFIETSGGHEKRLVAKLILYSQMYLRMVEVSSVPKGSIGLSILVVPLDQIINIPPLLQIGSKGTWRMHDPRRAGRHDPRQILGDIAAKIRSADRDVHRSLGWRAGSLIVCPLHLALLREHVGFGEDSSGDLCVA
jgi:hypothetical protein